MNLNTIKTAFGYLGTLVERATSMKLSNDAPESVYNYLALSERLATSGQPTRAQFETIKAAGYETIINLLPHELENALKGEEALIGELGLNYIYIPVDFKNPLESDYQAFCLAVERYTDRESLDTLRCKHARFRFHVSLSRRKTRRG